MKRSLRLAVLATAITILAPATHAFRLYNTYGHIYGPTSATFSGNSMFQPTMVSTFGATYLAAGSPEAIAMISQVAPMFPTWAFGTGSPHTGVIHADAIFCGAGGVTYPGTQGFEGWVRFRATKDSPPYPTPVVVWEPAPGTDGTVTYPSEELRWMQQVVRPSPETPYINRSNMNFDPIPFYWSEAQDLGASNGSFHLNWASLQSGTSVNPTFIKRISYGILRPLIPVGQGHFPYNRTTRVNTFLCRFRVIGGVPTVTVLDGYQMGMITSS